MSRTVRIAVAPDDHDWRPGVVKAVERVGATVVVPDEAEALVWLGRQGEDLREYLHAGIRWVQLRGAGVEYWLETGEIDDKRLYTSARGAYGQNVAEHVLALIFAAARRLHVCARLRRWDRHQGEGRVLRRSTVGIIGAGGIGQDVIEYLKPIGVTLVAVTRSGRPVKGADQSWPASAIGKVWPQLDYAVLLAPATNETAALVDGAALDALPDHCWVINLARGSLVDTDALVAALRAGTIGGAALDVTDPEPLPDGHPLWEMPNVLITPHVANPTRNQQPLLEAHIVENVARYARGEELLAVVDLELGY